jgi:uncharacterized protein (TIGR00730 family)
MKTIAIFCGSSKGNNSVYSTAAQELARLLAADSHSMITGGGKIGSMGIIADEMLKNDGKVIGVIPEFLEEKEVAHKGLTEMIVVNSMHERKQTIEKLADAFIALPGGFGTLDEIFEIITWAQLDIHRKPCGILNTNGYFDNIIQHIHHMVKEGFVDERYLDMVIIDSDPENLLKRILSYQAPIIDKAEIALGEL